MRTWSFVSVFSLHEVWTLEAKTPSSDTCCYVITPLRALCLPPQWLPVSHAMTMGASEPLRAQVYSRVRLTYCLGHMQTQGLDSFKGFPTTMSQACLLFPWLSTCFSHWVTFLPLNITQLCFQIDTPVVILNIWPA